MQLFVALVGRTVNQPDAVRSKPQLAQLGLIQPLRARNRRITTSSNTATGPSNRKNRYFGIQSQNQSNSLV